MKNLTDSTLSQRNKEVKRMKYEWEISHAKSNIAIVEDVLIEYEKALDGRGESSIIRYY